MTISELVENLVAALREELQQYGEMLARLDEQQTSIVKRAGDQVLASVANIEEQAAAISEARARRADSLRQMVNGLKLPPGSTLLQTLPHLPSDYHPLIKALVQENNELVARVQQRSRQNHLLLMRSLETMQKLMQTLIPNRTPACYNGAGTAELPLQAQTLFVAIG
jgi:hypothetical protein